MGHSFGDKKWQRYENRGTMTNLIVYVLLPSEISKYCEHYLVEAISLHNITKNQGWDGS